MKRIVCEMCGSTELLKQDGIFICRNCATQYSVEEAKKLMIEFDGSIEVKGTIEVDNSRNIANVTKMADDAFDGGNYEQAYNYFSIVLQNDYENAYATFMLGLSSAYRSTLAHLNVNELAQAIKKSLDIKSKTDSSEDLEQFVLMTLQKTNTFCVAFHKLAVNHRNEHQSLKSTAIGYWEHEKRLLFLYETVLKMLPDEFLANEKYEATILQVVKNAKFTISELFAELKYVNGTKVVGHGLYGSNIYGDNWVDITASYDVKNYASSAKNTINTIESKLENFKKTQADNDNLTFLYEACNLIRRKDFSRQTELRALDLLEKQSKILNVNDKKLKEGLSISGTNGVTFLILASDYGYIDIVSYLIEKGVDVNQKNIWGETALFYLSCKSLDSEKTEKARKIAQLLLNNGASANVVNTNNIALYNKKTDEKIAEIIRTKFPNIEKGKANNGCYVATAVYGSYDCPQVWTLRRYRDNTLAKTWYGRLFIKTYYAVSPTLVKWFGHTEWFKKMWKGKLDRLVCKLQTNGVEATPYEDKNW